MRNVFFIGLGILLMLTPSAVHARTASSTSQFTESTQQGNDDLRRDLQAAKAKVYPALVNISVDFRYYSDGRAQKSPAGGSGVIVSPDGYVITNYHVAGN